MHRFYKRHIGPLIEAAAPRQLMEIGAEFGWNTRHVLRYCRETGGHIDVIDPVLLPDLANVLALYPDEHTYHRAKSVEAIPRARPADFVLLDGDHNWRTVFAELTLIFARNAEAKLPPPIIVFHDCGWPYGRRDMYYNPSEFSERERQPYAYRGMIPGCPDLVDNGMNGHLANALYEGGPQNGVMTAIEDFIAACGVEIDFKFLPFFNGLGVLVPAQRSTQRIRDVVAGFYSSDSLLQSCIELEEACMLLNCSMSEHAMRLTQRTDALNRARTIIGEKNALIEQLRGELEALRAKVPA